MREQSSSNPRRYAENSASSPAMAWNWWGPAMACGADWNTKWHENTVALSGEWQDFMSRRIKEDVDFVQRIANARTPDAIWGAYARFWQRAAEDYAHEYARLARLNGNFISSSMTATQRTLEEAAAAMPTLSKAA